jgi:GTP-binding protein
VHVVDAEFITSAADARMVPYDAPHLAMVGRSNVGKSTLLNALLKRRLARTSAAAGKTRLLNFYRVTFDRFAPVSRLYLVDLPGYGYARVPRDRASEWKRLIENYLTNREPLRLCILILDARRGWMEKDLELRQWLEFHRRRFLVIATKMDKLNQSETERGLRAIRKEGVEPLAFSATKGRGVREIWQAISTTLHNR